MPTLAYIFELQMHWDVSVDFERHKKKMRDNIGVGGKIERVVSWSDAASSLLLCVSSEWPVSHSVLKCSAGEELVQQKGENEKGLFDRIIG